MDTTRTMNYTDRLHLNKLQRVMTNPNPPAHATPSIDAGVMGGEEGTRS
jgi:hypothetical protein